MVSVNNVTEKIKILKLVRKFKFVSENDPKTKKKRYVIYGLTNVAATRNGTRRGRRPLCAVERKQRTHTHKHKK